MGFVQCSGGRNRQNTAASRSGAVAGFPTCRLPLLCSALWLCCHLLREKAAVLVFRQLPSRMTRQQNQHHLQMRLRRSMNRDCNFKTINQHHDVKCFVAYYNSVIQALGVLGMVSEFVETQKVPLRVSVEDVWFWLTCLCTCTVEFTFSDSVAVQLYFLPVTLSRCHSI